LAKYGNKHEQVFTSKDDELPEIVFELEASEEEGVFFFDVFISELLSVSGQDYYEGNWQNDHPE